MYNTTDLKRIVFIYLNHDTKKTFTESVTTYVKITIYT